MNYGLEKSSSLPIFRVKEELIKEIDSNPTLIVTGDTGSGKSTQISQFLYQKGYRGISITQPRRVGAISLASRVSKELKSPLGTLVGYSVRFNDCTSSETQIKYLTDGCLLRECLTDKNLNRYEVVILDEAHERSLQTDILFGLLLEIVKKRSALPPKRQNKNHFANKKPFRLIITSATLDTKKFCEFFNCKAFEIPGRCFPVEIRNLEEAPRTFLTAAVNTVLSIHRSQPADGHILVFLTGRVEIEDCCEALGRKVDELIDSGVNLPDIVILPDKVLYTITKIKKAYSTLRACEQEKIFYPTPQNCRKVVFATNIAETSLTVPGVRFVIDSGFVKQKVFNERTGIDSLVVVPISKVSAIQRAGRAGRTCPGICYRLYSLENFEKLANEAQPEIQRSSLPGVLLLLKALGVSDPLSFPFIDSPSFEVAIDGLRTLFLLGALNDDGEITSLGRAMARLPLDPSLAKLLLYAAKYNCTSRMLTIASMLSAEKIWVHYTDKEQILLRNRAREAMASYLGDPFVLESVFMKWKNSGYSQQWAQNNHVSYWSLVHTRNVRTQLEQIVHDLENDQKLMNTVCRTVNNEYGPDFIEKDGFKIYHLYRKNHFIKAIL